MKFLTLGLNLLKFALNNLRRSPGRTILLSVSIGLTTMMINVIIAFYVGLNTQIIQSVVQSNVGDYQVVDAKFDAQTDPSSVRILSSAQKAYLTSHFDSSVLQLVSNGFITTTYGNNAIQLIGDDFQFLYESQVLSPPHLLDGGVIIGKKLAQDYNLKVGDTFIYNYQSKNDELFSELVPVQAIYEWNSSDFQTKFVYASKKLVAQLLQRETIGDEAYQQIILRGKSTGLVEGLTSTFASSGSVIKTWKEVNPEMATVVEFNGSLKGLLLFIIGFTVVITILTPVNVTWNERLGELKSLNILGMSVGVMRIIGFLEAFILGAGIGLLSSLLSYSLIEIFYRTGIDISFMNGGQVVERAGIELPTIIHPIATLENLSISFFFPLPIVLICYLQAMNLPIKKLKAELK